MVNTRQYQHSHYQRQPPLWRLWYVQSMGVGSLSTVTTRSLGRLLLLLLITLLLMTIGADVPLLLTVMAGRITAIPLLSCCRFDRCFVMSTKRSGVEAAATFLIDHTGNYVFY